jgi:hypothetical protein
MPIMPKVEVPPKPSSSTIPSQKEVINIDDDAERTVDSGKNASSSKPIPEERENTSVEALVDDAAKKLMLSHVHGTPATHPRFFPVL